MRGARCSRSGSRGFRPRLPLLSCRPLSLDSLHQHVSPCLADVRDELSDFGFGDEVGEENLASHRLYERDIALPDVDELTSALGWDEAPQQLD